MMFQLLFVLHKLRFLYAGILATAASLFIIWLSVTIAGPASLQQTRGTQTSGDIAAMSMSDSPNAVTNVLASATHSINQAFDTSMRTCSNALQVTAATIAQTGNSIATGTRKGVAAIRNGITRAATFTISTNARSIAFVFETAGRGVVFTLRIPGAIFGLASRNSAVNAVIQPADHADVPIIDPRAPAVLAAKEALPATPVTAPEVLAATPEVIWPLHGQVTTEFGVPGWPYKGVHAGIDISDGKPSGTTPIKAFRRGKVIAAERSGGLGNHVVVDHGSGVTSVYGHLASIGVQIGQEVDTNSILGYEGSTGVSTGPHLHFEIRVNGQATDPRQFINGQP